MAKGRRPKPKAQLRLAGNYREDRHASPDPLEGDVACPDWVSARAVEFWPEISRTLQAMRLASPHYSVSMALLVDAIADFAAVSAIFDKEPWLCETCSGGVKPNPIVAIKAAAWDRVLKICKEFGMTPCALRSVDVPDNPTDELSEFMKRAQ